MRRLACSQVSLPHHWCHVVLRLQWGWRVPGSACLPAPAYTCHARRCHARRRRHHVLLPPPCTGGTEDSAKAIEAIKALTAKDAAPGALAAALDMPDARGNTALMLAARWGNIRLVEELVALGANPNAAACYYEFGPSVDPSRAEADVGRGANGERGFQCLTADVLTAPDLRADDVLTAALKPPDGSAKSRRSHRNATGEATLTGEGKEAKKLLYPTWGQLIVETPLHNAAEQTRGALAAILAREGVCVNLAISPEGWTPLHVAANTVKLGQLCVPLLPMALPGLSFLTHPHPPPLTDPPWRCC